MPTLLAVAAVVAVVGAQGCYTVAPAVLLTVQVWGLSCVAPELLFVLV
jgi:hypothetical protein